MNRPPLSNMLSAAEFLKWYWLKSELQDYCREHKLVSSGGKADITRRIQAHLEGRSEPLGQNKPQPKGTMPDSFAATTVIGQGWRCTQGLRAYFQQVQGPGFRFNEALRTYIATSVGATLAQASAHYESSLTQTQTPIPSQFEYNRHTRAFYQAHPGATRQQVISAWWAKRGKPGG